MGIIAFYVGGLSMTDNNYRVRLFGNFSDIDPYSDKVWAVMEKLRKDFNLLPTTVHEMNVNTGSNEVKKITRPAFISQNNDFLVEIGSDVITIEKANSNSKIGVIDSFLKEASFILDKLLNSFGKRGYRVSLITSSFGDIPKSEMDNSYNKGIVPLEFYKKQLPMEWNSRSVSRIDFKVKGLVEKVNVITELSRVQGSLNQNGLQKEFDDILITFDINTVPEAMELRIDTDSITEFLNEAVSLREEILYQVRGAFNGEVSRDN